MRQAGQSTDAQHKPVNQPGREVHTGDMKTRDVPAVDMDADRETDEIILVDGKVSFDNDYVAELAFMEERLTIVMGRTSEKFAPAILDFYVNGKPFWVPVGRKVTIPRKYVEVIARAQPYDVRTNVVQEKEREQNLVERHTINKYPFSVIDDPSGAKGIDWLTRIMQES